MLVSSLKVIVIWKYAFVENVNNPSRLYTMFLHAFFDYTRMQCLSLHLCACLQWDAIGSIYERKFQMSWRHILIRVMNWCRLVLYCCITWSDEPNTASDANEDAVKDKILRFEGPVTSIGSRERCQMLHRKANYTAEKSFVVKVVLKKYAWLTKISRQKIWCRHACCTEGWYVAKVSYNQRTSRDIMSVRR